MLETETKKKQPKSAVDGGVHQSIARVDLLLSALGSSPELGLKLTDVCRITGLGKATAHRLLAGLVSYRLADHDVATGRYFVGFKVFAWASGAGNRYGLLKMATPALQRLVQRFEDAVYLTVRFGDQAVCVERLEGAFPIKTLAFKVGDYRPLGVGAGSAAILASLSEAEVTRIMKESISGRRRYMITDDVLRGIVRDARRNGYSFVDGKVVPGICTVGVPILLEDGSPVAAISISAISDRMKIDRRREVAAAIATEIEEITREFAPLLIASNVSQLTGAPPKP